MKPKGFVALLLGGLIAVVTAVAHMSCIVFGPSCFKAQLAPPHIIRSAMEGTSTAAIETTIVSSLFLACALFAVSGAGLIRRLPFLKSALITISIICLVRGLATIPLSFYEPVLKSTYGIISGFIWFLAGCLYLYGFLWVRQTRL